MSHFHLTRTRTRSLTPDYTTYDSRPLLRRDSKHQRRITLSDDEDNGHDDYPYSPGHQPTRLSRALTIRNQPSQLERYNIWSDKRGDKHASSNEESQRRSYESRRSYKSSSDRHNHHHHDSHSDPKDREFHLAVKATFGRPNTSHHHHHHESSYLHPSSSSLIHRKEKWVDEGWEMRERSTSCESRRRRDSLWDDVSDSKDEETERWSRYWRTKKTSSEEWRPLSGWRRERIVYGS